MEGAREKEREGGKESEGGRYSLTNTHWNLYFCSNIIYRLTIHASTNRISLP